jgi:hypothetical protein
MSVDTSTENQDEHLQDFTDEQLDQLVYDTIRANEVLSTETQMFEKFYRRVETKIDLAPVGALGVGRQSSVSQANLANQNDGGGTGSRLGRKRSKSRTINIERMLRLTAEQKCEIAQRELEEYADEVRVAHEASEKHLDGLRAKLEEADIRLAEIRKEEYEFERDIAKGAVNPRTGKPIAEKVTKYLDDRLRSKEALIVKLRLKNTALKVQKRKLQMQLRQKEEMGEVLLEVDFSQLKIENQQYIEKIDERNQELLRLKMMAGNTLQVLNAYKKKMSMLMMESERIKSDIAARQELLGRIDVETKVVEEERQTAEAINRRLRQQLTDYRVPDVMDYVSEKAKLYELQKKVRSWERKVEIANMALKTHQKTWRKIQSTGHRSAGQLPHPFVTA